MAMTTVPNFPLFDPLFGSAQQTTTLDTTDDWVAFVFNWPGGDLTKAAILCSAVSGSPVLTVQLFNTDATDGGSTWVNTGSAIGAAVDTASLAANVPQIVTGIGQAALAAGVYALRVIFKSGTSAALVRALSISPTASFPLCIAVANGGAQGKVQASYGNLVLAVGGASWVPLPGLTPPAAFGNVASNWNSTSNPDEYGLWATNTFGCSIRLAGVQFYNSASTLPDVRIGVYSGSLASPSKDLSQTLDRDLPLNGTTGRFFVPFSTKQTVAAGASFGIGIRAATGTSMNLLAWDYTTGLEALMDAWWGQGATLFTRENDAGALTQTIYKTPLIIPYVDGIDASGGGGGPLIGGRLVR